MNQRPRIHYTESQKALMWDRWQKGESLQQIAQLFDRNHSSIQRILAESGGIRPAPRRRSRLALTLAEREEISRAVVAGHSMRSIANGLGRAPSTISREIKRNGTRNATGRIRPTKRPGIGHIAPRLVNWLKSNPGAPRGRQAPTAVVAGAGSRMAEAVLPGRRELPSVTRDHLSQPLHSSPWRPEERAVAAFAAHTSDASFAPSHAENRRSRQNH